MPAPRRRTRADEQVVVEQRVERVAGDVGDLGRELGAADRDREAAEHPLVDEAELRGRRGRSGPAGGARRGLLRSCTSSWPLMPRWPRRASPLSSGSQRYLPRRRAPSNRRPVRAAAKPAGPRGSRRTGRGWRTRDRRDGAADDVAGQAVTDGLDLGELGHGRRLRVSSATSPHGRDRARRTPSPRRPARPPSWSGRCRCRSAARPHAPAR